jgi:hypothetical protein
MGSDMLGFGKAKGLEGGLLRNGNGTRLYTQKVSGASSTKVVITYYESDDKEYLRGEHDGCRGRLASEGRSLKEHGRLVFWRLMAIFYLLLVLSPREVIIMLKVGFLV